MTGERAVGAEEMEYWTPARALVVVAHPDDIEFGCAGTVARWVHEGAHVTYALVTNGAAGSSDPEMTRERLAELREAEARASAKVVGVDQVEFLGYEDGLLEPTLEVRERIVRLIRRVRPEVVVTTDPTTRYFVDRYINHPDHRAAGEATLAAVIPGSDTRLAYPELLEEGLEPVKLTGVWVMMNTEPNLVVDIGEFIDRSSRRPTSRSGMGRRSGCSGSTCRGSRRPTRRRRSARRSAEPRRRTGGPAASASSRWSTSRSPRSG
jgi:LmbE family N-acetylglucosaminyl deacetylase